ncbi:class I adenylate-forming enzyme family protein [Dietzia alimentaria]|uniref:class I adenylate-forming enzyme family protein n=1 Tax=Dietzia alimentaria TaxID=665550 RepID=UPI00029A036B|nr:class I adenylate-forming enzyme family protein [Dietzia alimentaria]
MVQFTDPMHSAERVAEYRSRGWWDDRTLYGEFRARVAERGDALALVDPLNREALVGSPPRRLTWNEVDDEVTYLAARLLEHGVRAGDVVGIQLPNSVELAEAMLATWAIGVVASPLAMQYRQHELTTMGGKAGFRVILTCARFQDRSPAADAIGARAALAPQPPVLTLGAACEAGEVADAHLVPGPASTKDRARVEDYRAEHPHDPNHCVTLCWTSGTEGQPKGVPRADYEWVSIGDGTTTGPAVHAESVLLNPFPMINMGGISGMFLPWLFTGCLLVQHHPFDAPTFFRQIATERVTYTLAPPALLWMLLHNEDLQSKVDLSSLTHLGSGSAPLQPAMVRGWQEQFGLSVINNFGSNEGVALISLPEDFPDPADRARFFPRFGAPGVQWHAFLSDRVSVQVVDMETGEEITEPGVPGELRVDGPTVFAGYLDGENVASPFDEQGRLRSGDVFEIAGENNEFLLYVDRNKDLIIRGGMNIAPVALEAMIAEHPAVAEVAVIGDPDEVMGERVAAVVALRDGCSLTLDELVSFLRDRKIGSYQLPERLEVRPELPRNAVGKLLKRDLRRRAAAVEPGPSTAPTAALSGEPV